jgi:hypothetical protein
LTPATTATTHTTGPDEAAQAAGLTDDYGPAGVLARIDAEYLRCMRWGLSDMEAAHIIQLCPHRGCDDELSVTTPNEAALAHSSWHTHSGV